MLTMTDTPIEKFIPYFANTGVPVAFLVPTPTGYEKSIMDATGSVRQFLLDTGVHDYEKQGQGPENKVIIPAYFVNDSNLTKSEASLYRPITKKGDPRIWFYNLKAYCKPCNLLALLTFNKEIYVLNLSKPEIASGLMNGGFPHSVVEEVVYQESAVANELLGKLRVIHSQGFLRSITPGDPEVGDTLENALGIKRNNAKTPDYRGIELKTTRITRHGSARKTTRTTLFTKVPDEGMTYREIVDNYGKVQVPRGSSTARLQLYETLMCSRPNAYDLILDVEVGGDRLGLYHQQDRVQQYVSAWQMASLKEALLKKHHETFWVKAVSEDHDGVEYFRYDKVQHTKTPNASLLAPLLETDKITVDLAAHYKPDGKWRDHGVLFKMDPNDLSLLFGEPIEYDL